MERTLAVFGVTGQTGRALVNEATARGWAVRGLARGADADIAGAAIVHGSFDETTKVLETIGHANAVCCVIGPRPPDADVFCAEATFAIVAAMRRAGCSRLVCVTGAMVGPGRRSIPFNWLARMADQRQPRPAQDRREQERIVEESGLEWTVVKPPRLTNGPARRDVACGPALRVGLLSSISRADVAAFILDCIEQRAHVGERLFVRS